MEKSDTEKDILVLWNTSGYDFFYSSILYANAFPIWLDQMKKKRNKPFCLRIDSVGW